MDKKIKVKKYTGVYLNRNKWHACIGYKCKNYYLGSFKNKKDAIKIRKEAEKIIKTEKNFENWYQKYRKEKGIRNKSNNNLDIPIGAVFGRLKVIRKTGTKDKHSNYLWECQCQCGNIKNVSGSSLLQGSVTSCGCNRLNRKKITQLTKVVHKEYVLRKKNKNGVLI